MPFSLKKIFRSTKNKLETRVEAGHVDQVKVKTPVGDATIKYQVNSMVVFGYNSLRYSDKILLIYKGDDRYSINRDVDRSSTADIQKLESEYPVRSGEITGRLRHSEESLGRWNKVKDWHSQDSSRQNWYMKINLDEWQLSTQHDLSSVSLVETKKKKLIDELQGPCLNFDGKTLRQVPVLFGCSGEAMVELRKKCLKTLKDQHVHIPSAENQLFRTTLEDADLDVNTICDVDLLEKCIIVAYKLIDLGGGGKGEECIPNVSNLKVGSNGHIVFEIMLLIKMEQKNGLVSFAVGRLPMSKISFNLTPRFLVETMTRMKRFHLITKRFLKSEIEFRTDDGKTGWIS